ncbi:hypothetical protein B0H14DRAFT_3477652 [Mycena olivaceomarginata]|nr:hypothetical protein B0H14DRAFT_3477652 [Mycena olivaceomarginata]
MYSIVSTLAHFLHIVLQVVSTPRVVYLNGYHTLFDLFRVLPRIPTYDIQPPGEDTRTTTAAIIAWSNGIRAYTQNGNGDIREGCVDQNVDSIARDPNSLRQTDGCYHESGEFRATAIPNADIAAFWHNSRNGYFIHVFRTSYEKILHHHGLATGICRQSKNPIGYLSSCGSLAGSISGTTFTDNDTGIDNKVIRKPRGAVARVGGFHEFALQEGEDITQVLVCADGGVVPRLFLSTSPSIVERGPERRGAAILNQLIDEARGIAGSIAASAARNTQIANETQRWLLCAQADRTGKKLTGVLVDDPESVDAALKVISASSVAPNPVDMGGVL